MSNISCPPGHSNQWKSIYDRELDTILFKRLHRTNYTLAPKYQTISLGPGSYNPKTIDEIYQGKTCGKYGPFYQQSKRFPMKIRQSKHLCRTQEGINGICNIPDEIIRKKEFERRYNSIRLDRQSDDRCHRQKQLLPHSPPVTLYEKRRIYGPYVKLAKERSQLFPDWYKGPARLQGYSPTSIFQELFSRSNQYKGKFLPIPLNSKKKNTINYPGPTAYFHDLTIRTQCLKSKNPSSSFLSSSQRFHSTNNSFSSLGPASYNPHTCSKIKQKKNRNL